MWLKLFSLVAILANAAQSDSSADLVPAETLHYEYGRSYDYGHHHQPYGGPYGGHGYRHKAETRRPVERSFHTLAV